ncbi:MAG TPA: ATP-binding protein [Alphaproteobacteria bacterium]|nr:ATP-binding protein [Alphaproteobacteria bacterium]
MATLRWFIILASALFMLPKNGPAQGAVHWSIYKTADGLAQPVYNSLFLTPQGNLIGVNFNSSLVCKLDGYSVSNFSIPFKSIQCVSESPGGQLWALSSKQLLELRNGVWVQHPLADIIGQSGSTPPQARNVPEFLPVRQGCVILLFPKSLVEFSAADPAHPQTTVIRTAAQMNIGQFSGLVLSPDGGLWICGEHGAAKTATLARNLSPNATWQTFNLPEAIQLVNLSGPQPDDDGGITFIAESSLNHQMAAVTYDGGQWTVRPAGSEHFLWAWRGPARTFWAASAQSLFQWDDAHSNWVENEQFSQGQILDVKTEPGGAFWLATSGELIRGSAALWEKPHSLRDIDLPVESIVEDSQKRLYFIAKDKLYAMATGSPREFAIPAPGPGRPVDYALFPLENGSLLVKAGDALYQFQPANGSFKPFQSGETALGILPDGNVCIYHANSGFEEFDGSKVRSMDNAPAIDESSEDLTTLLVSQNGDLWMGGNKVLWRHGDQWRSVTSSDQPGPISAVAFVEMTDGTILCATRNEIWEFNEKKGWTSLQYGFNHINGLMRSRDGSIWIASNGGLYRLYKGAWLENAAEEDFPNGPVPAIYEDEHGQVWAATTRGLRVFHPEADADPPRTFVRRLGGEGSQLSEGSVLDLLLDGRAKWKFTPSQRLLYSWQLDGSGWSSFQDAATLSFPSLAAGRHSLQVSAIDAAGNVASIPATLDFTVTVPWFKELRLWIVLILGLGVAIFFGAVALNRHRQLVLSHAAVERKVAERTHELEIATRELLQSQKMNALGTLAAGIAHDFNNILSIIKGSAQIIEDNLDAPDKIRTRVDRIKTIVQQGAEIVDAMLGFSRGSDAVPASCDVNSVVADTMRLLGDRFLRTVDVRFDRAENLPEIFAQREFIQQILLNFIFNAAEAMSGRKEITLATSLTGTLPADIFLAPAPSASFVLVSVRDIGSGIAPEIISRIFEPFFTTKAFSARRGTGLGLSMVYELAKKMGAGLAVESVVGRGSRFTLILPVTNIQIPAAKEEISK